MRLKCKRCMKFVCQGEKGMSKKNLKLESQELPKTCQNNLQRLALDPELRHFVLVYFWMNAVNPHNLMTWDLCQKLQTKKEKITGKKTIKEIYANTSGYAPDLRRKRIIKIVLRRGRMRTTLNPLCKRTTPF